jgi:hypothetical protein
LTWSLNSDKGDISILKQTSTNDLLVGYANSVVDLDKDYSPGNYN